MAPTKCTVPELSHAWFLQSVLYWNYLLHGSYKVYCNRTIKWFLQSILYRNYHGHCFNKVYRTIKWVLQSLLYRNYHVVSTKCTVYRYRNYHVVSTKCTVPELSRACAWFLQSVPNYHVGSTKCTVTEQSRGSYKVYCVPELSRGFYKVTVPELSRARAMMCMVSTKCTKLSRGFYKVYCNGTITWFLQSVLYRNYHVQGSYKYYCTGTITKFLQSVLPRNYHVVSTKCTVPELLVAEPTVAVLVLPGEGQLCQVLCTKL